jgi:hypothetical protein
MGESVRSARDLSQYSVGARGQMPGALYAFVFSTVCMYDPISSQFQE